MSLPVTVPFMFGNATTTQSLSSLDTNFTTITNSVNGLTNGASQINVASISATGTANATTYLRGDGAWATVTGGGGSGSNISNGTSNVSITSASGPVSINTNGNNAVYIDASQNVGIGTTSPSSYGTNITTLDIRGTSGSGIKLGTAENYGMYYNGVNGYLQTFDASPLVFASNNLERMRIDSSGNLLVGTTTSGGKVFSYQNSASTNIGIDCGASMGANAAIWTRVASTSTVLSYFLYNATNVGSITTNGTSTAFNTSSDYRLKENVQPMTTGLAIICSLKPVTYDWISDNSQGEGFIAHELQAVIPHAVTGEKDAVNEDGNIKPQGVDYSKIVVHLVAAIQELSAKNDALEARLVALESK